MKPVLVMLLLAQLVAPNGGLPQVLFAKFSTDRPVRAGQKAEVTVKFDLNAKFKINRDPKMSLSITPVKGVTVEKKTIEASGIDPKAKDEYYVDLPTMKVNVTATKPGKLELPGKLTYFFCSKADGFCSKQTVDVKIPLDVQ